MQSNRFISPHNAPFLKHPKIGIFKFFQFYNTVLDLFKIPVKKNKEILHNSGINDNLVKLTVSIELTFIIIIKIPEEKCQDLRHQIEQDQRY